MVKKVGRFFRGSRKSTEKDKESPDSKESSKSAQSGGDRVRILKKGHAMRVIFFYPGEEGTYVDNCDVTLYENGIIHIASNQEETTTHLQNCEILWRFETEAEDRANKLRLLKPKAGESAKASDAKAEADASHSDKVADKGEGKPGKGSSKNPELR